MRLRLLLGAAAGIAALATPASAVVPATDCHGIAFSDPAGDQYLGSSANTVVRPTAAIDIRDVYVTGSGLNAKVNIQVGPLTAWNNTQYTFRWNDPAVDNLGGYFELRGDFFGTNGTADVDGGALMTRHTSGGSTIWLAGHGTARAFHGAVSGGVEGPGVIQLGFDQGMGVTFPATLRGMKADAFQYESNALTSASLRRDSAVGPTAWTQPC